MQIFVPRYRHTAPHTQPAVLNEIFVAIDPDNLADVMKKWVTLDALQGIDPKSFFKSNIVNDLGIPAKKRCLMPYLLRPHITVHAGAKPGAPEFSEFMHEKMFRIGELVAIHGFNLWTGGGGTGLMKSTNDGFTSKQRELKHPDQFSIQVIPAAFYNGTMGQQNGLKAFINEDITDNSDVAIVMPDFVTRRELLDSHCAAAITGFGGTGTLDELTDIMVHIKTGLRSIRSYLLDMPLPGDEEGYYKPIKDLLAHFVRAGLESTATRDHLNFMPNPEAIFEHLMIALDQDGYLPEIGYQEHKRRYAAWLPANHDQGTLRPMPT